METSKKSSSHCFKILLELKNQNNKISLKLTILQNGFQQKKKVTFNLKVLEIKINIFLFYIHNQRLGFYISQFE